MLVEKHNVSSPVVVNVPVWWFYRENFAARFGVRSYSDVLPY